MSSLPWQSMDSAPRDTWILLRFPDGSCSMGKWDDDRYAKKPKPHWKYEKCYLYGAKHEKQNQPDLWLDVGSC